jgi:hypothetical protein
MKHIVFIIIILISSACYCQDNDSIVFTINGHVLTSESDLLAKYPKVVIRTKKDTYENINGDSLGQFHFCKKIGKDLDYCFVVVDGIDNYKQFYEKIYIDTSKLEYIINHSFTLEPEWICVDTWLMPDIIFAENSIKILKSVNGNGLIDSLCVDTILNRWINRWKKEFVKSSWKTKIEIQAYADYNENAIISKKRLNIIYKKLLDFGIPQKLLRKSNKCMQPRDYYKYRDGCHPYYLVKDKPLLIDEKYINSINDLKNNEEAKQLRRVVTFNWIFYKE